MILILAGCQTVSPDVAAAGSGAGIEQTYAVTYLTSGQCEAFLRPLGVADVAYASREQGNAVVVRGTPSQLQAAEAVLHIVDSRDEYCVENLGPASGVRALPSNRHIAAALGKIRIGTFNEPPANGAEPRAIIDIQADSILAFLPVRYRSRLRALLASEAEMIPPRRTSPLPIRSGGYSPGTPTETNPVSLGPRRIGEPNDAALVSAEEPGRQRPGTSVQSAVAAMRIPEVVTLTEMARPADSEISSKVADPSPGPGKDANEPPKTVKIRFSSAGQGPAAAVGNAATDKAPPVNGDEVLTMTLPETMTLIQLLDLMSKYVGLDYVYDPKEIPNQPVTLKLHGELRGEIKVRHLYALTETVLGFMNLAMIRQQENLVAVVPMDKALATQPQLVGGDSRGVQVGDTVVTRVFEIRHVEVSSVMTLLQNMKLSVAATPLDGAGLLLVTCHADRMNRIEQLVEMIDRPGRPAECRFRRLCYIRATPLIAKVRTLAGELEGIAVATPSPAAKPPAATPAGAKPAALPKAAQPPDRSVYLDTDERTNRILMIGFAEELTLLEELIDVLDVAQEDPRTAHIYTIRHVPAPQALDKLQKLEVLQGSSGTAAANAGGETLTGEPLVAVLETTNQLLVKAGSDQHARIREFLGYIDVLPTDSRTVAAYPIRHIDANLAKQTLEELDLVSVDGKASAPFLSGPNQPAGLVPVAQAAGNSLHKAPIVVSESTNALLVKATPEQHARIAAIVQYIDRYTPEEQLLYQVYPLESSSPDHLAGLLERLIQETTKDKDGKIEKVTPKIAEQITVVPDPNTFSLIVYASQKNHKWIEGLITRLDKRRPQVLIDVTLVEITRTDSFEYDLNLVASTNNAVTGNLVIDPIQTLDSGSRLEGGFNLLDQDGNPTGRTRAFYSDQHVQALLTAIQRKNYGRVLAKPKVLVDDGRKGQIMTTDTTTYVKESIQIPQTGNPITTREFVPIEASIQLEITPHISEGNLLRLDVYMSRDDFGSRPASGAPPDKATSEVTTAVFVPDDSTVILGGLVKLNQSKGGSKVPILGDLPVIGMAFRSIDNSDIEKKMYVFLKANIVRPYDDLGLLDLREISEEHRDAFEQSESEFQQLETIPGIPSEPMPPEGVLRGYK